MNKPERRTATLAMLAAIFVVAVWGETFVSTKVLLNNGLEAADIFFYRFILAYLCMWPLSYKRVRSETLRDELIFLLLGVTGGSLYFLFENNALQYSTASNVAILVGSAPLATACLAALFFRSERMNLRQVIGSLIAFAGMVMVILNGELVLHLSPRGDMLALGASFGWAVYSILIRQVSDRYDVAVVTRKVFGYGVLTILPYFLISRPLLTDSAILARPVVWGNLVYLGLIASMLCFVLWNWALSKLGTVRTTNLIYGQSFFTMAVAYLVLGERITWMAIAGAAILIIGMSQAVRE